MVEMENFVKAFALWQSSSRLASRRANVSGKSRTKSDYIVLTRSRLLNADKS